MRTLIEDYERRLKTAEETIATTTNTGSDNDIAKMARLNAKASEYRTFIAELYKAERRAHEQIEQQQKEEQEKIELLCHLYYRYKKTEDQEIRDYLKTIKIVKMEKQAGGTITKYYPLNAESMKKIKAKPRNVSLTFDAGKITPRAISGYEEYKTVTYLSKSTSRFFLKPDIGEIFDAIDFHDLMGGDFDAICFNTGYETLPNTDGEHHIMTATLLVNPQARRRAELKEAVKKLYKIHS